ncbi:hypothetical protein FN846DRAFT_537111 [Sphaerosporella brunnea]|uniref:Probable endonuclease LCL3 n=1 Tax=Sphaerosporella brunnea TaxID=1250544 RepID=A0A5J5EEC4_9PEZI|nr:hypothetical protein FN846DRAFT_537111 [Sphaerosporella brunnea]
MKWPPWDSTGDQGRRRGIRFYEHTYAFEEVLLACLAAGGAVLAASHLYRNHLRRVSTAAHIPQYFLRRRSLFGPVTSVGDGDNFRIYHTPGGRLLGWGWLPGRRVPTLKKDLKDQTVHVRIAGVDAPECAHFGNPSQPYSEEALEWLKNYVSGRRVRAYLHSKDQFDRVVATVVVRRGLWRRDVGYEMLKAGMATMYEAKFGAEFGGMKEKYAAAEERAKNARLGLWRQKARKRVSPAEFKRALRQAQSS